MSEATQSLEKQSDVLCEIEDGIATLTLNRPQAYNTLTSGVIAALSSHLEALASKPVARVIIIASTGKSKASCKKLRFPEDSKRFLRIF